ncbi:MULTISPECIES: hypothetical protein [unclassified Microcoleus]|uniref:hypothetical protein n=1 Tax=unclassified Microcoleus TaxID=2642155 RepID=UPI002FD268DA
MGALRKNVIRFDSQLEFEVFRVIARYFPIEHIDFHFKIELKPKTQYSGTTNYFVDFRVKTSLNEYLFLEAKGLMTKEASLKIKLLEILKPEIHSKLIICSAKKEFYFGKSYPSSVPLESLNNVILSNYATHRRY